MRAYVTFYLWTQSILIQLFGFGSQSLTSLSRVLSSILFVLTFLLVLFSLTTITRNRYASKVVNLMIPLFLILSLCPLIMYLQLGRINEINEIVRLYSWLLLLPLSSIAFNKPEHMKSLKRAYLGSFMIIMLGFFYANLTRTGISAYNLNYFFLGGIQNEATASLCVSMMSFGLFLPVLLKGKVAFEKKYVIFASISFLVILAILKRSAILAFPLSILFFGYNLYRSGAIKIKVLHVLSIFTIVFGLILTATIYAINNPEIIEGRTKDFSKFEETGDTRYLGAGRFYLAGIYIDMFANSSFANMLLGQFPLSSDIPQNPGYLNTIHNHPHNDFLDITLRGGIISFFLFYSILGSILILALKQLKRSKYPLLSTYSALIIGLFLFYLSQAFVGTLVRLQAMSYFSVMLGSYLGLSHYYFKKNIFEKRSLINSRREKNEEN